MRAEKERRYKVIIWLLLSVVALEGIFIIVTYPKRKPEIAPLPPITGKIAVVIDDWGYSLDNLHILDEIKYPLTAAILPNLIYSNQVAGALHNRGLEIMLHLPLQPRGRYNLEKDTITISHSDEEIRNIIARDLAKIVYAKGVSNHMGSRATEEAKTMKIVFRELKKRRLYFLDSLVTSGSVCSRLASQLGVDFVKRDVFLDNDTDPEYIKRQIYKLKTKAKISGQAIGIGHDRKTTLEALKEIMPELEKEGFRFVYVSELANRKRTDVRIRY